MKHLITKDEYGGSKNRLYVDNSDPHNPKLEAYSYSWWKYLSTDSVGNIIFNNYQYSRTTSTHQSETESKIYQLGYRPQVTLFNTTREVGSPFTAISEEVNALQGQIEDLNKKINTPRTRKAKNIERKETIQKLNYLIKDLIDFRDNYLDKKKYPNNISHYRWDEFKKDRPFWYGTEWTYGLKNQFEVCDLGKRAQYIDLKSLFKKQNGVLDVNTFKSLNTSTVSEDLTSEHILKLKQYLNLPLFDHKITKTLIEYRYTIDISRQLPDPQSEKCIYLQKQLNKFNINKNTITLYNLDKLHTILINYENNQFKKDSPSTPYKFDLPDEILSLTGDPKIAKHLTLIESPQALRIEGKRQGHCIGGKHYVDSLKQGFVAFNYKGYTFYLDPSLTLRETKGKHNSWTPEDITSELFKRVKEKYILKTFNQKVV